MARVAKSIMESALEEFATLTDRSEFLETMAILVPEVRSDTRVRDFLGFSQASKCRSNSRAPQPRDDEPREREAQCSRAPRNSRIASLNSAGLSMLER